MYETLKSLHIIVVITWFAGLFYLPRLYVYHANTADEPGIERFKVMEHKLFHYIMTPSMLLTLAFGTWLWLGFGFGGGWMHAKLTLVVALVVYHFFCYRYLLEFAEDRNQHSHRFYRIFNELPTLLLVAIVFLVVFKPF
ncbi:MAG: protoporphyrinogen oxidase HemJ [bacterium]|nr:protoporphyrinogen oxidase HemJ [bacterium]